MIKINSKLNCMQTDILRLTQLVEKINRNVKKESGDEIDCEDWGVVFPMMSIDQLDTLERCLEDPQKYQNLVEYIKQIGGFHVQEITHRAMQRIMGTNLGCMFSWLGKKGKLALSTYKVAAIFKEAILSNSRKIQINTTERDVEKAIMEWLRHAPQKCKRQMLQF